jgi:hypothetical protein
MLLGAVEILAVSYRLRRAEYHIEGVVDLMADAAGQRPDGRHLLGLDQGLLGALLGGDQLGLTGHRTASGLCRRIGPPPLLSWASAPVLETPAARLDVLTLCRRR